MLKQANDLNREFDNAALRALPYLLFCRNPDRIAICDILRMLSVARRDENSAVFNDYLGRLDDLIANVHLAGDEVAHVVDLQFSLLGLDDTVRDLASRMVRVEELLKSGRKAKRSTKEKRSTKDKLPRPEKKLPPIEEILLPVDSKEILPETEEKLTTRPVSQIDTVSKCLQTAGRLMTADEIADKTGLSTKQVQLAIFRFKGQTGEQFIRTTNAPREMREAAGKGTRMALYEWVGSHDDSEQ